MRKHRIAFRDADFTGKYCARNGKLRYISRKQAKRAAKQFGNLYGDSSRSYWCGHCQGWHLTTK
jgi:hypothetical protein